jgi:PIN like domain
MVDVKKPYSDPLVRQRVFPNASEIFKFAPVNLGGALRDGIVVVDTNVLLIPYTTGRASLEQIRRTYDHLTKEDRLRIPGQVAREFADNRAEKLKGLFQQLSRKRDINLSRSEYPLLEGIPEYSEVTKQEADIETSLAAYRKAIGTLLDTIASWHWNDPVSVIYRDLFNDDTVVEPQVDREDILNELKYRQEHRIPPGYKDANNEYSGVGDLLIWKTLLQIGRDTSRHLIFVSGDEKTDWRYQSENRALYPRFELLDEYRIASKGKSLLIISFAQLLEQFGVPAPVVAEVREEESAAALVDPSRQQRSIIQQAVRAENAVFRWLTKVYPSCEILQNHKFPDFLVRCDSRVLGYEVKYVSRTSSLQRRIRDTLFRLSAGVIEEVPISLVFVLGEEAARVTPRSLTQTFSEIAAGFGIPLLLTTILVGIVTGSGEFVETWRLSL